MATSGTTVAKSGWMYRQSSVLKKWRRYFFSLTVDGIFRYFETEFETKAEDAISIPVHCTSIKTGTNVLKIKPPEGLSENFLLSVETSNGKSWIMCGESLDEIKAWQLALEEARHIMHHLRSSSAPPMGVPAYPYAQPRRTYVVVNDYDGRYYPGYSTGSVTYTPAPQVVYSNYPGQVLYVPSQQTTVIYDRDRNYCSPLAGGATGLIAGAALGSLMFSPFLFAPFWC